MFERLIKFNLIIKKTSTQIFRPRKRTMNTIRTNKLTLTYLRVENGFFYNVTRL